MTDISVNVGDTIINVSPVQSVINVSPVTETIVQAFPAGLKGDKGDSSNGLTTTVPIGTSLSGHTVIVSLLTGIEPADNTNATHLGKIIGITEGAATSGMSIGIVTSGGTLNGFTGLVTGSIYYLSTLGTITNSVLTTGFIQQIGIALSATELSINITTPIATN